MSSVPTTMFVELVDLFWNDGRSARIGLGVTTFHPPFCIGTGRRLPLRLDFLQLRHFHTWTLPYGSRRCSSMAEHLICNLEVTSSTLVSGSDVRGWQTIPGSDKTLQILGFLRRRSCRRWQVRTQDGPKDRPKGW